MPDLPELYEALDETLDDLIHPPSPNHGSRSKYGNASGVILALCAAIEVKQSQELNEYLNESTLTWGDLPTPEDLWGDVPEDNVYRVWYEATKKAWDKREEEAPPTETEA